MQNKKERWFSQKQAERFTGNSRVTLWHSRMAGKLPFKKVGREIFYPLSALKEFKHGGGETTHGN